MFKARFVLFALFLTFWGVLVGLFLPRWIGLGSAPKTYNSATMLQQVQTLSQLVTVKYVLEKVMVVEAPPETMLGQMFAGQNRVLMLAHGIVKAGIDMSKLQQGDVQ